MPTEVLNLADESNYRDHVQRAAEILRNGGLVAFPTETVYGVGARADSPDAVAALRNAKGREETKPFTVHIARPDEAERFVPSMSSLARRLMRKAWPGPITLVFPVPDRSNVDFVKELGEERASLIYHDGYVGIRCPDDRFASDFSRRGGRAGRRRECQPRGSAAAAFAGRRTRRVGWAYRHSAGRRRGALRQALDSRAFERRRLYSSSGGRHRVAHDRAPCGAHLPVHLYRQYLPQSDGGRVVPPGDCGATRLCAGRIAVEERVCAFSRCGRIRWGAGIGECRAGPG